MSELVDATGLALADVRHWLTARVSDWPTPPRIVDKHAAGRWRQNWIGRPCWFCGQEVSENKTAQNHHELHHLVRHDAAWAFTHLCADCHRIDGRAVTRAALHRLLTLKHRHDRENTSWLHLALAMGRFLPEE